MNYIDRLPQNVQNDINVLRASQYEPHLIGGVLRVAALGGTTSDVDIALIVDCWDGFITVTLDHLGYSVQHTQDSKYANDGNGFLADYRKGDVNIILYSAEVYGDVRDLVSSFDLNINKYYLHDGVLCNDHFDGELVIYTESNHHNRHPERITRFRCEYPDLDWSQPTAEFTRLMQEASDEFYKEKVYE